MYLSENSFSERRLGQDATRAPIPMAGTKMALPVERVSPEASSHEEGPKGTGEVAFDVPGVKLIRTLFRRFSRFFSQIRS